MQFSDVVELVGGLASIGEPLYALLETESIPSEDDRKLMARDAFRHELEAGRVKEGAKDVVEYRKLRKFISSAPVGVVLSDVLIENGGIVLIPKTTALAVA